MIDFEKAIQKSLDSGRKPIELSGYRLTDNEAIAVYRMAKGYLEDFDHQHPSELDECELILADRSSVNGGSAGLFDVHSNLMDKRVVVSHENGSDYINAENKDLCDIWDDLIELAGD